MADLGEGSPNSFNFMQFLGKFGKIICCRPRELAPPSRGNPGSATEYGNSTDLFVTRKIVKNLRCKFICFLNSKVNDLLSIYMFNVKKANHSQLLSQ